MSFPLIQYKATNVHIEEAWQTLIEQKFQSLEKYLGKGEVKCHVEFEKIVSHQKGDIHRVEANLTVSGKLFRAEATEQSFELAIDKVRSELDSELAKAHQKHDTLVKKGGQKIKDLLRFGK